MTELQTAQIGGVPFAVGLARGKRAVLYVAGYDSDGLLETPDDCRRAARKLLERVDAGAQSGDT